MSLDIDLTMPGCKHCGRGEESVHWQNITHNLGQMASEAGIYQHLWRPEEIGVKYACELIVPINEAIKAMEAEPDRFREFDAPNGWGRYDDFVPWLRRLVSACEQYPGAEIGISR